MLSAGILNQGKEYVINLFQLHWKAVFSIAWDSWPRACLASPAGGSTSLPRVELVLLFIYHLFFFEEGESTVMPTSFRAQRGGAQTEPRTYVSWSGLLDWVDQILQEMIWLFSIWYNQLVTEWLSGGVSSFEYRNTHCPSQVRAGILG